MKLPRHRARTWQAWLALFAIVLQALLPTLAQAVSAQSGHAIEICTAEGIRTIHADEGSSTPAQSQPAAHAHCLLCNLGGHDILPPVQHGSGFSGAQSADLRLPRFTASPAALPPGFLSVLLSRAPPTLS
jgi:hypothetical protein